MLGTPEKTKANLSSPLFVATLLHLFIQLINPLDQRWR